MRLGRIAERAQEEQRIEHGAAAREGVGGPQAGEAQPLDALGEGDGAVDESIRLVRGGNGDNAELHGGSSIVLALPG